MKDIGAHAGYTVLWDKVSKVARDGVQMCYYPVASPFHVMVVLSGIGSAGPMGCDGCSLLRGCMRVRRGCGRVRSVTPNGPL
jgi:hypothetical protein